MISQNVKPIHASNSTTIMMLAVMAAPLPAKVFPVAVVNVSKFRGPGMCPCAGGLTHAAFLEATPAAAAVKRNL